MKVIYIKKCSDAMMWYADKVGRTVPFIREESDCYLSREPAGYTNIVKKDDADIVEIVDRNETVIT